MEEFTKIDVLTARVQELEQQLEQRNTALLEAGQDLETFTYKISHDLHAPLRAINSYMEMIRSDYTAKPLDDDALRMISRVTTNVEEMKQMLDGLLEFVRTGKKELNKQLVNMSSLVKEICDDMQKRYPERKFVFHVENLPDVYADADLVRKVWMQLISNAVKFTGKKEESIIDFHSYEQNNQVVYSIKDNGDGFDMSFYTKLFGVFQRLHHKTEFEGTGIGLAIADKIVTQHQGKIWAEAKVKEGAVFYFSLPK